MSKINLIFLNYFFIEEYQFRGMFFVVDQFLKQFFTKIILINAQSKESEHVSRQFLLYFSYALKRNNLYLTTIYIHITYKSFYFTGITVEDLYENFERPKIKVGAEWVTKGQNTTQVIYIALLSSHCELFSKKPL